MNTNDKLAEALPPLPHTDYALWREARPYESDYLSSEPGYSADDMRTYALAALDAKHTEPVALVDGLTPHEFALRELYEFQKATGCDTAAEFVTAAAPAAPAPHPLQALTESCEDEQNAIDAERYRWLRTCTNEIVAAIWHEDAEDGAYYGFTNPEALDAEIDAAIAASTGKGGAA